MVASDNIVNTCKDNFWAVQLSIKHRNTVNLIQDRNAFNFGVQPPLQLTDTYQHLETQGLRLEPPQKSKKRSQRSFVLQAISYSPAPWWTTGYEYLDIWMERRKIAYLNDLKWYFKMKYFRQPDSKGVLCPVIIRTPQTFFIFLYFFLFTLYLVFLQFTLSSLMCYSSLKKKNLPKCNLGDISSLSLLLRKK